jgi:hypothetical protein
MPLRLLRRQANLLILLCAAALVWHHFFFSRAYVEIDCTVDHDTAVELHWAEAGQDYSRARMGGAPLKLGRSQTGFFLGDLRAVRHLRLDPMARAPGAAVFHSITIRQPGLRPVVFASAADFARFKPGRNVSSAAFIEGFGWSVTSTEGNPDLHLTIEPPAPDLAGLAAAAGRFLLLALGLHLLLRRLAPLAEEFRFVPLLLFGVTLLAAVMAVSSRPGSHPDEQAHSAAAAYYEQRWLPPAADAPDIAASYSGYGFSRLNSREIAYFLIGKVAWLTEPLQLPAWQRHRLFNVLLLGCLGLLAFRSPPARLLLLPLLMTPQGWYLFSYCNSDAFALFITLLAAYQLAEPKSQFNRLLAGRTSVWSACLRLGLLAGLLLLMKKNFYIVIPFAGLFLTLEFVFRQRTFSWTALRQLAAVAGIGMALFSARAGLDVYVNGWNKAETIERLREERAERAYKPSTELSKQHPHLNMKARGVSLNDLLGDKHRWGGHIIRSFYGVYGQMSVGASKSYYTFMQNCGWLFLAFAACSIAVRGGWPERLLLLNLTCCGLALVGGGIWASWTKDFQPQGRYMLPLLPMLGLLLAKTEPLFQPLLLRALFLLMFLLSLGSFLFVGIASHVL